MPVLELPTSKRLDRQGELSVNVAQGAAWALYNLQAGLTRALNVCTSELFLVELVPGRRAILFDMNYKRPRIYNYKSTISLLTIGYMSMTPAFSQRSVPERLKPSCEADTMVIKAKGDKIQKGIVFCDQTQGCFHSNGNDEKFHAQGGGYIADSTKRSLSEKSLKELVGVILDSAKYTRVDLNSLNITPASVRDNQDKIRATVLKNANVPATMVQKSDTSVNLATVSKVAMNQMHYMDASTTRTSFTVTIDEPKLSKEPIKISSTHACAWMLPWAVTVGSKHWETYSIELPLKLKSLISDEYPHKEQLDGTDYWRNKFWTDSSAWSGLSRKVEQNAGLEFAKGIAGFSAVEKQVQIDEARFIESENSKALYLQIKRLTPAVVNSIWWTDPTPGNKAEYSWTDLFSAVYKTEQLAERQKWLIDWKKSEKDHTLEAHIIGTQPYTESAKELADFVLPAWKDAKFAGVPEMSLLLRRNEKWCGTVFLSSKENRALIVNAQSGKGNHWFDKLNVAFHPKQADYIVVDENGKASVHKIAPDSADLPAWARTKK